MPPKNTSHKKLQSLPAEPSDSYSKSHFVNDDWVGGELMMKPGTIRVQRYLRKQGKPHWFDVEPTFVGTSPRYLREEVEAWLRNL